MDIELDNQVKEVLRRGRVTLTEDLLLDGAILSTLPATFSDGKEQINVQLEAMDEPDCGVDIEELHPAIWRFSQAVTKGTKLA